jgi:hypothetical protein
MNNRCRVNYLFLGILVMAIFAGVGIGVSIALKSASDEAARLKDAGNLNQVGLAITNYAEAYDSLPPWAITDKEGKPLLSWRVAILQFIEQESLYREFRLDEPWDSSHNLRLLERMPSQYRSERSKRIDIPNTTHVRIFIGKNTPWAERPKLEEKLFQNGLSGTLMLVETEDAVPWTKPDEIEYLPDRPLPNLGVSREEVLVVTCDGHYRFLGKPVDEIAIRKMIRLRNE